MSPVAMIRLTPRDLALTLAVVALVFAGLALDVDGPRLRARLER